MSKRLPMVQFSTKRIRKKFKSDLKQTIDSIALNPFLASVKYENTRTVACKNFPYSIHFEIDEAEKLVRIISILHFSKKPFW